MIEKIFVQLRNYCELSQGRLILEGLASHNLSIVTFISIIQVYPFKQSMLKILVHIK